MQRFEDKVVIVTGAGSGIGAATARRFASEGAKVVLVGRRREKLEEVAATLAGESFVRPADVSVLEQVEAMVQDVIERYGRLDVLVNNAGVAKSGKVHEASLDDWRQVMAVDVDGVFYGCRVAMPWLIKSHGSIVNVSSVSGLGGDWGMSFYNAAKGAISNFTRSLALDHGEDGVRVNAVCPSSTESEMSEDLLENEELVAAFQQRIPMGRVAKAEEVGDVIVFLASDDARFVSGVNLPVDGGLSASNGQPRQA